MFEKLQCSISRSPIYKKNFHILECMEKFNIFFLNNAPVKLIKCGIDKGKHGLRFSQGGLRGKSELALGAQGPQFKNHMN